MRAHCVMVLRFVLSVVKQRARRHAQWVGEPQVLPVPVVLVAEAALLCGGHFVQLAVADLRRQ